MSKKVRNYWDIKPIVGAEGKILCNYCMNIIHGPIKEEELEDVALKIDIPLFCNNECKLDYYVMHYPII